MKFQISALVAGLALAVTIPSGAQTTSTTEYQRQQNVPPAKVGTSESRKAERKETRAEVKAQAKAGEMPKIGDNWQMAAPAVEGTKASRSAERKEKRAEMKDVVKSGQLPQTTEAYVSQPPTKTR